MQTIAFLNLNGTEILLVALAFLLLRLAFWLAVTYALIIYLEPHWPWLRKFRAACSSLVGRSEAVPGAAFTPDGGSPGPERVLALLERGVISADQAADLIAALKTNPKADTSLRVAAKTRRSIIIGAGLVFLGFFLPWAKFNFSPELGYAPGIYTSTIIRPPNEPPTNAADSAEFQSAADLNYDLGWAILWLAVASAMLPLLRKILRMTSEVESVALVAMVAAGATLSLYVATQLIFYLQPGLLLNLAGYGLMSFALLREYRGEKSMRLGLTVKAANVEFPRPTQ